MLCSPIQKERKKPSWIEMGLPMPLFKDINLFGEPKHKVNINTRIYRNMTLEQDLVSDYYHLLEKYNSKGSNNNNSIIPINKSHFNDTLKKTMSIKRSINEALEKFDMMIINKFLLRYNK